ncbi:iroquois-class homeodomain protein IRX-6 [Aquarana catesbeiana]|uniref:iroquois-class homeodomain protein IRX-6 n=1 Tax=Aquarana catesbeiana TaxID=8400 RepID=UPI003CC93CDA
MSFSQFSYPYNSNSQFLVSVNPSTICYDTSASGSLPVISAASVQTSAICCPSYEKRLLVSTRTNLNAAFGMYNPPQTTASLGYASYLPCSSDPTAFYSTLTSQYEMKDSSSALHSGISQPSVYSPYDHSLGQYQYDSTLNCEVPIQALEIIGNSNSHNSFLAEEAVVHNPTTTQPTAIASSLREKILAPSEDTSNTTPQEEGE